MDKNKAYYVALVMRKSDRILLDELWEMSGEYDLSEIVGMMSDWTNTPTSEIWSRILRVLASYVLNFNKIRYAFRWIDRLDPTLYVWCYCYLVRRITTDREIIGWLEDIERMRPYKGIKSISDIASRKALASRNVIEVELYASLSLAAMSPEDNRAFGAGGYLDGIDPELLNLLPEAILSFPI